MNKSKELSSPKQIAQSCLNKDGPKLAGIGPPNIADATVCSSPSNENSAARNFKKILVRDVLGPNVFKRSSFVQSASRWPAGPLTKSLTTALLPADAGVHQQLQHASEQFHLQPTTGNGQDGGPGLCKLTHRPRQKDTQ